MVSCLHQGNIYTKRKPRVWRERKCILLVGAITPHNCAGRHNTLSRGRQYRASLVNWDGPMAMVPHLHQGNIYTKRKLRVWRERKCIPLVGAITPHNCTGRHNTRSRGRQYRAQNVKFGKMGRTYGHATVFTPRKYLYQKEATGMERTEMYSVSRCNNPTYLCRPSKCPF